MNNQKYFCVPATRTVHPSSMKLFIVRFILLLSECLSAMVVGSGEEQLEYAFKGFFNDGNLCGLQWIWEGLQRACTYMNLSGKHKCTADLSLSEKIFNSPNLAHKWFLIYFPSLNITAKAKLIEFFLRSPSYFWSVQKLCEKSPLF